MRRVQIKGTGQNVDFPDSMTEDEMRAALQREFSNAEMMPSQQAMTPSEMLRPRQPTMQAYEPSLQEKAADFIGERLHDSGVISDRYGAQRIGDNVSTLGGFTALGGATYAGDAVGRNIAEGNYGAAALEGGLELLGAGGDALAIFAGVAAKGADLKKLEAAKKMEDKGADRDEIWEKTGWFNDRGDWKFEISDDLSVSNLKTVDLNGMEEGIRRMEDEVKYLEEQARERLAAKDIPEFKQIRKQQKEINERISKAKLDIESAGEQETMGLGDAIQHRQLSENYPESKYLPTTVDPQIYGGSYRPKSMDMKVGTKHDPEADPKSSMLHETQHYIQDKEGFYSGGNPRMFESDFAEVTGQLPAKEKGQVFKDAAILSRMSGKDLDLDKGLSRFETLLGRKPHDSALNVVHAFDADELNNLGNTFASGSPEAAYRRLAGEAEARLVQTRMNMTPEERLKRPPWYDLDVPESELIYKKDGIQPNLDTAGVLSGDIDSLPMDQLSRRARATEQGFKTSAFSGSTHNIDEFNASIANPESDWGRGIYASSSIDDVNANYARSDGADLTGRIEQEKERLMQDIEDDPDAFGVSIEDFEDDPDGVAERIAKERLVGDAGGGVVYPLEINTDDFAVINGRDSTKLEQPDYRDEAESTIDRADYDDDWEFEDAIQERIYELEADDTESLSNKVAGALGETDIYEDEGVISSIMEEIQGDMMEGELNLGDLDAAIRANVMDAYDSDGEMISAGEVSRQVMQNLGFKGVADKTVNRKFGSQRQYGQSMEGMDEDTVHYIVFPDHENLIRSKNAKFDPKRKSSKNILASVGGATVAYGVAKNQSEDDENITKTGMKYTIE